MDSYAGPNVPENSAHSSARVEAMADQASEVFIGRWRHLVSTTNWEKGRIIAQWRDALVESGASATEYSDESWANRVGGVTSQHVGRLRRVFQRFGTSHEKYRGLYWSHFHSAVEWDDAEMWLEGAVQNDWSVSEMRRMRWETLGAVEELRPRTEEIVASEVDEDVVVESEQPTRATAGETFNALMAEDTDAAADEEVTSGAVTSEEADESEASDPQAALVRPFEGLSSLPSDLADAFEAFKLAILRHKADGWTRVPTTEVLASLDALKALVLAPSEA